MTDTFSQTSWPGERENSRIRAKVAATSPYTSLTLSVQHQHVEKVDDNDDPSAVMMFIIRVKRPTKVLITTRSDGVTILEERDNVSAYQPEAVPLASNPDNTLSRSSVAHKLIFKRNATKTVAPVLRLHEMGPAKLSALVSR